MADDIDYAELMEQAAADSAPVEPADLAQVQAKAARLVAIELQLADIAEQEKLLKKERALLRIKQLPEMMASLNMTIVGVGNQVVKIEAMIQAGLPKDPLKRKAACDYLVDMREGGVIKRQLIAFLPKGNAVVEQKLLDLLRANFPDVFAEVQMDIHYQTYLALVKRLIRSGKEIDKDKLGIFVGHIARVLAAEDIK